MTGLTQGRSGRVCLWADANNLIICCHNILLFVLYTIFLTWKDIITCCKFLHILATDYFATRQSMYVVHWLFSLTFMNTTIETGYGLRPAERYKRRNERVTLNDILPDGASQGQPKYLNLSRLPCRIRHGNRELFKCLDDPCKAPPGRISVMVTISFLLLYSLAGGSP